MTVNIIVSAVLAFVASLAASSGFWAYLQSKDTKKDATLLLLLGLAHDRIIYVGMGYLERGWITKDEYEDYMRYLYEPYRTFGGNGLAERITEELQKLPIKSAKSFNDTLFKEHKVDG